MSAAPRPGARRLIFTISSGRSGTEYLAQALGLFAAVEARHEPKPRFSSVFRAVVAAPHVAREFWEQEKLARIERGRRPIYAETSHLFCKGFAASLVELGRRPTLVHLVRDARATALSLLALDAVPGRRLRGVRYYLSPSDPNHLPVDAREVERWSDYQLCYWYVLENRARAAALQQELAPHGVRVVRAELAALQDEAGLGALGTQLELGPLSALGRLRLGGLLRRRVNAKDHQKRALQLAPAQLDDWETAVRAAAGVEAQRDSYR